MSHYCPYGKTCTADDLCAYCERNALRIIIRYMAQFINTLAMGFVLKEFPAVKKIMDDDLTGPVGINVAKLLGIELPKEGEG